MPWSKREIEMMAEAHFKGGRPRCPVCQAPIEVEEMNYLGSSTVILDLNCPRCGESAEFSEPHLAAMDLEWSQAQLQQIENDYWTTGQARCPSDGTILSLERLNYLGSAQPDVQGQCNRCGRQFGSALIHRKPKMSPFEEKYEFLRPLNKGGMGTVSLVRARATGQTFAAKSIKPEYLRDPQIIRRFQREKRLLASMSNPHIVAIEDAFIDESGGVFVMEYMAAGDLTKKINDRSVSASSLVDIFDDIVAGVAYFHSCGIWHRDLKPGNVLIDERGRAKISDFGLAVLHIRDTSPLTATGAGLGTRHYAAPEQLSDAANVDGRADIYALGLIAYEILTRASPWRPPIRAVGDPCFDAELGRAIDPDPSGRPTDAKALAAALRGFLLRPT